MMAPHDDLRQSNDDITKRAKVVVIGAGASGLMCTYQLLQKDGANLKPSDIVVLEARDRVGGRIHTIEETLCVSDHTATDNNNKPTTKCLIDHGAAWVHGTGREWDSPTPRIADCIGHGDGEYEVNPMMELFEKITPEGEDVCDTHLNPIFKAGNPWMRPGHVLIKPKGLVLFINGMQLGCSTQGNESLDDGIFTSALKLHSKIMQKIAQIGHEMISCGDAMDTVDQSFQQALDKVLSNGVLETLKKQEEEDQTVTHVAGFYRHLISCWHATDAKDLQLYEFSAFDFESLNVSDEQYTNEGDYYGPHCTVNKGMQTVLEPLLGKAGGCIRLNEPVIRIKQSLENETGNKIVRVTTLSGTIIEADCCVVTVSQGCLLEALRLSASEKQEVGGKVSENTVGIYFETQLSTPKTIAIRHLCMGSYKKVFLTFDHIFWPRHEAFIGLIRKRNGRNGQVDPDQASDGLGDYLLLDNLWARDSIPCMEAILIGRAGQWATNKPGAVIKDAVLQFLTDAMGLAFEAQLQAWCVDCHVTRWEEDPYSRGAYSGYQLGTLPEHTEDLAIPDWEGRLVFAGEATVSGYEGSVHGALISGKRAAKQVVSYLAKGGR